MMLQFRDLESAADWSWPQPALVRLPRLKDVAAGIETCKGKVGGIPWPGWSLKIST